MPDPIKLKKAIDRRGVTQRELAKAIDSGETYVSRMVNNRINAREDTLKAIAEFLDCTVNDLI